MEKQHEKAKKHGTPAAVRCRSTVFLRNRQATRLPPALNGSSRREGGGELGTYEAKAIPHNSARGNPEKNWVLIKALFCRNTLCISRKSDEIRARFFREMPKAY